MLKYFGNVCYMCFFFILYHPFSFREVSDYELMYLLITVFLVWSPQLKSSCGWFYFLYYRCTCADGFEGENCEINVDDCEDNDCENNSTCVDGINNYTCLCPPEYTGKSIKRHTGNSRIPNRETVMFFSLQMN